MSPDSLQWAYGDDNAYIVIFWRVDGTISEVRAGPVEAFTSNGKRMPATNTDIAAWSAIHDPGTDAHEDQPLSGAHRIGRVGCIDDDEWYFVWVAGPGEIDLVE